MTMNVFVLFTLLLALSVWAAPVHDSHPAIAKREQGRLEFHFPGLNSTAPMFKTTHENGTTGNATEYHTHYTKLDSRQTKNETNSTLFSENIEQDDDSSSGVEVCIHEDLSQHVKSDGYCRLGPGVSFEKGPNGIDDVNETSTDYQKINAIPEDGYFHPRRDTNSSMESYPKLNASLEHPANHSDARYQPIPGVEHSSMENPVMTHPVLFKHKIANTSEPLNAQHVPKGDGYGSCHIEAPATGHAMPSSMSMYAKDCRDLMGELAQKSGFYLIAKLYEPLNIANKGSCYFNVSRSRGDDSYVKLWNQDVATVLRGLVGDESEQAGDVAINSAFGVFQCNGTMMQWSVTSPDS